MRLFFLFIFIGLSVSHGLYADDEAPEPRAIPFQVYLLPGGIPPGVRTASLPESQTGNSGAGESLMKSYVAPIIEYCPSGEGASARVDAAECRLSGEYVYTGPNQLVFFQESPSLNAQTTRKTIGSVDLPPSFKRALLCFFPNQERGGYNIFAIDPSLDKIRPGQALVKNVTPTPIACLFNDQQFMLAPGESTLAALGPASDFTAVLRIAASDDEGEWKEKYGERLVVAPQDSLIALIINKPGRLDQLRILVVRNPMESAPHDKSDEG
jgi:hypothetical protein